MKAKVNGAESFKALKDQFMVGPSVSGYTLAYSADNEHFTPYTQATPAGENLIVNGAMQYGHYMLSGNTGEVEIIL